MTFGIRIPRRVAKDIGGLQTRDRDRLDAAILALRDDPRPAGVEKLSGSDDLWRIRVGDYRVVYKVDDASQVVSVVRAGHRRDIYRR